MARRGGTAVDSRSASGAPSFDSYGTDAAANYDRYFVPAIAAPLAVDLIEVAAIEPGERVLDVGCGTGIVARFAAERVGPAGSVSALDINPGMLALARSAGGSGDVIDWHQGAAESIPLPAVDYDAALCQMGLQFFADRAAALGEIRRVLVSGGRLAANVPGPTPPFFAFLRDALRDRVGPEAARFVPTVFSLHDPDELSSLVAGAGFEDVMVGVQPRSLPLPAPAEFLWQYASSTPLARVVAALDDDGRMALQRDVVERWERVASGGRLILELDVVTVTGRKA